jgi:ABC-type branched-subunit amino acid transport system ATPase component
MEKEILRIENLSKSFGGLKLFEGVTFSIREGTINSLFGSNGSGKTTFFNLVGGYEKPDTGTIRFNGRAIKSHHEFDIAKAGVGRMWQDPTVFPNHTVLDNLLVSAKTHPGESFSNYIFRRKSIRVREAELQQQARQILQTFKLGDKGDQLAGSLSLGEKKLLSISMLLMNDAQLLLLDEPFSGVNPNTIQRISQTLIDLRKQGRTIFMIEHKIRFAEAISDHLFKIENYQICELN